MDQLVGLWGFGVVIAIVIAFAILAHKIGRATAARTSRAMAEQGEKVEAMFRAMFPDLQPYFHPRKLVEYVRARRAQQPPSGGRKWKNPPGFEVDVADLSFAAGRERVRLLDAAGVQLAEFFFEENAEGGVLRHGKGKFTVDVSGAFARVRYWHPEREFKWTPGGWKFQSRMAEREFETSDSGTSFSSDSGSSSIARGAAVGAGVAAAGGAFDGGGASHAWDDSGGGSSSTDFGSVASGSSSSASASTAY